MSSNPLGQRILQLLALVDVVRIARIAVDRNRRGDGRPGEAVTELDHALDRFDQLGGFDDFWLDIFSPVDSDPADVVAGLLPLVEDGSERLRTTPNSRKREAGETFRTAEDGSERLRTTATKRSKRCH